MTSTVEAVDVVIPVKTLDQAKSRLRGAADGGVGGQAEHEALVLALVRDTALAAAATANVRRVLVVTSDRTVAALLAEDGVESTDDPPAGSRHTGSHAAGLNAAVAHGAAVLLRRDRRARVAALQADLPALRAEDLATALAEADGRRAFCADRQGTGSTLLVAAPGGPLDPRFGVGSAAAHTSSGAVSIGASLPSLRCDVDTAEDLSAACALGLGRHTAALVGATSCCRM
ncbi:MAG TPA: 2-phospho-L-lactate guanylyltransferase [Pseudonocardiaceae bacterium]|nr:2-phospho-L-lactate guanylyltransferase [Pseudonocardiaceae bacterium]